MTDDAQFLPASIMTSPDWLAEQLRLRSVRWNTDDARVLAALWWYSASAWVIGPTLISLARGDQLLSGDLDDLAIHWLPDSRITGATSSRVLVSTSPIGSAADSLLGLFEHVIPAVADLAGIAERPLWAVAADSIATRLLAIGQEIGEVDRVVGLLPALADSIGGVMPRVGFTGSGSQLTPRRVSCCLLYLAPEQSKCSFCPKLRVRPASPDTD